MKADDICQLTRSALSQQNNNRFQKSDDIFNIRHGVRCVVLKVSKNELTEQEFNITHTLNMHLHDGELLIEAEPMLQYLGASLEVVSESTQNIFLKCDIPSITLWEALDKDIPNLFDSNEYYRWRNKFKDTNDM